MSAKLKSVEPSTPTTVDIRHAAILAYRKAIEHPEPPLEDEGPDAPSDAELIVRDFELTDKEIGPLAKAA